MYAMIVTGHGHFATGMASAVRLLAGKQPAFEVVDFADGDTTEDLELDIKAALSALGGCQGVLICTDIIGVSPFKVAATLAAPMPKVRVVAGTNVAMLLTAVLERDDCMSIDSLAAGALEAARQSLVKFTFTEVEDRCGEDGI